jgi:hypothetical protein
MLADVEEIKLDLEQDPESVRKQIASAEDRLVEEQGDANLIELVNSASLGLGHLNALNLRFDPEGRGDPEIVFDIFQRAAANGLQDLIALDPSFGDEANGDFAIIFATYQRVALRRAVDEAEMLQRVLVASIWKSQSAHQQGQVVTDCPLCKEEAGRQQLEIVENGIQGLLASQTPEGIKRGASRACMGFGHLYALVPDFEERWLELGQTLVNFVILQQAAIRIADDESQMREQIEKLMTLSRDDHLRDGRLESCPLCED